MCFIADTMLQDFTECVLYSKYYFLSRSRICPEYILQFIFFFFDDMEITASYKY